MSKSVSETQYVIASSCVLTPFLSLHCSKSSKISRHGPSLSLFSCEEGPVARGCVSVAMVPCLRRSNELLAKSAADKNAERWTNVAVQSIFFARVRLTGTGFTSKNLAFYFSSQSSQKAVASTGSDHADERNLVSSVSSHCANPVHTGAKY